MEQILALIDTFWPISDAVKVALGKILHREAFPRKHWLLEPGQISDRIYFIEQGVAQGWYLKLGGQGDGRDSGWRHCIRYHYIYLLLTVGRCRSIAGGIQLIFCGRIFIKSTTVCNGWK